MEPIWTVKPSVLVDPMWVMKLFPLDSMNETEKANATIRLILFGLFALYILFPSRRSHLVSIGIISIGYLFFQHNKPGKLAETFAYDKVMENTAKQFDFIDKMPKNTTVLNANDVRIQRVSDIEDLQKRAARGGTVKEAYIKDLLDDKSHVVRNLGIGSRETTNRGEVVWSKNQQIYNTRPYVKPSTDEYESYFNDDTGPTKFLSRKTG